MHETPQQPHTTHPVLFICSLSLVAPLLAGPIGPTCILVRCVVRLGHGAVAGFDRMAFDKLFSMLFDDENNWRPRRSFAKPNPYCTTNSTASEQFSDETHTYFAVYMLGESDGLINDLRNTIWLSLFFYLMPDYGI